MSKKWIFTWNNYTPADEQALRDCKEIKFCQYEHEIAPSTGTPHLQGYLHFKKPLLKAEVLKFFDPKHGPTIKRQRGTNAQNDTYTSKDNAGIVRWGEPIPDGQGKRTDLDLCVEDALDGVPLKKLRLEYKPTMARYGKFIEQIIEDNRELPTSDIMELRPWQQEIWDYVNQVYAPPREIVFWVDREGGAGKSSLCRHLLLTLGEDVQVITEGTYRDIAYAISVKTRIFLFDLPRSFDGDKFEWSILEDIKNGLVTSSKYESKTKFFSIPFVIVFCNEVYNHKFSHNRVVIKYCSDYQ